MTDFIQVNKVHLDLIRPLLKWRILDLESLRKEVYNVKGRHNFYRLIRDLEKKQLLIGFRDPYTKKKYVYLSQIGECQYSLEENPTAVSSTTLNHDTKVIQLARQLINFGWIQDVELEHTLQNKKKFLTTTRVIPDALLFGKKNGLDFKMALELELSQKKAQRITEKARQYLVTDSYDYILYMFARPELMMKYYDLIKENVDKQSLTRFMFFSCPYLMEKDFRLEESLGRFRDKHLSLKELFLSS